MDVSASRAGGGSPSRRGSPPLTREFGIMPGNFSKLKRPKAYFDAYKSTRNSSGDERPERDIALFCYPSCI